jgi:hypothetical protein
MKQLCLFLLLATLSAYANDINQADTSICDSFLMMVEQDGVTSDLAMTGLTEGQIGWIRKNQKKSEVVGICPFPFDPTNKRIPATLVKDPDPSALNVKPIYVVRWKQEKTFVPDNKGGHYAIVASGILYRMDMGGSGNLIPIGPVHDTNRTIYTDSTVSLLKNVLKQVKDQR